ncbi:MAG: type III secretion system stator protein SctL [Puniceicoccales bacterium]|nr:type III secretion system stator protein SctL [Puniceicoccales bacterium]
MMLLTLQSNKKICPATRIVKYEDYAYVAQADIILGDAKAKSKKIIQQANMQAELIINDAKKTYEEEKQRGFQEGTDASQEKHIAMLFNMLAGGVDYLSKLEQTLIDVVQSITEKILGECPAHERITALVKNALKSVPNGQFLKIHVPPEQAITLKTKIDELLQAQPHLERIEIEGNNAMQNDQCILETETGILDASLDVQLNTLMKAIESIIH